MSSKQTAYQVRREIVTLRKENPEITLRQIGELVNRTRERVRQILVSENIETRSSKRVENDSRPTPICRICHQEIISPLKTTHNRVYCDECVSNHLSQIDTGLRRRRIPQIDISCAYCNTVMTMRETLYKRQQHKYKNIFCSSSCRSRYTWQQQGIRNVNGRVVKVPLGKNI